MDTLTASRGWLRPYLGPADVLLEAGAAPGTPGEPSLLALQEDVIRAFPEYRLATYFTERPAVLAGADHIVVARHRSGGELLGLVVARLRQGTAGGYLHAEMNLITAGRQRRGLLLPLWRVMLTRLAAGPTGLPGLVAMKTYNPMVYSCLLVVARLTGAEVYPPVLADGPSPPGELPEVAQQVAAEVAPTCAFDPRTGALRGAGVPRDFYPAMPTTSRREVQGYFARHLRPGDRLLCLVRFGPGADMPRLLRRWKVGIDLPTEESNHA